MAAYVIANVEVTDAATYERYRKDVPATIEKYGGRFLVRGGAVEALEGDVRAEAHRRARVPERRARESMVELAGVPAAARVAPERIARRPVRRRGGVTSRPMKKVSADSVDDE